MSTEAAKATTEVANPDVKEQKEKKVAKRRHVTKKTITSEKHGYSRQEILYALRKLQKDKHIHIPSDVGSLNKLTMSELLNIPDTELWANIQQIIEKERTRKKALVSELAQDQAEAFAIFSSRTTKQITEAARSVYPSSKDKKSIAKSGKPKSVIPNLHALKKPQLIASLLNLEDDGGKKIQEVLVRMFPEPVEEETPATEEEEEEEEEVEKPTKKSKTSAK